GRGPGARPLRPPPVSARFRPSRARPRGARGAERQRRSLASRPRSRRPRRRQDRDRLIRPPPDSRRGDRARVPAMTFPLATSTVEALGLDPKPLARLRELITAHVAESRYPAAQIPVAPHGKLRPLWRIGDARLEPQRAPARDDTLWLLYSNTKVITACAVWILVERGALAFTDRIADHVPGFEANGKGDITVVQLLSHQGGFPSADV